MEIEELYNVIHDAAFVVRQKLGLGFAEPVYQHALSWELTLRGVPNEVEYPISVYYKGKNVGNYKADLLVDNRLIIECKAVEDLVDAHFAQLLNYLAGTRLEYGLLINFGTNYRFRKKTRTYNPFT